MALSCGGVYHDEQFRCSFVKSASCGYSKAAHYTGVVLGFFSGSQISAAKERVGKMSDTPSFVTSPILGIFIFVGFVFLIIRSPKGYQNIFY